MPSDLTKRRGRFKTSVGTLSDGTYWHFGGVIIPPAASLRLLGYPPGVNAPPPILNMVTFNTATVTFGAEAVTYG